MDPALLALAQECGRPVEVATIAAVASVESGLNPFAIRMNSSGKEGMPRQPLSASESEMRANALIAAGHDLDLGLMGVAASSFDGKFGQAFNPCTSIKVFVKIFEPAREAALKRGLSEKDAEAAALNTFYGRGDASAGEESGYARRVMAVKQKLKTQLGALKIAASADPLPDRTSVDTTSSIPVPKESQDAADADESAPARVEAVARPSTPTWDVYKSTRSSSLVIFGGD